MVAVEGLGGGGWLCDLARVHAGGSTSGQLRQQRRPISACPRSGFGAMPVGAAEPSSRPRRRDSWARFWASRRQPSRQVGPSVAPRIWPELAELLLLVSIAGTRRSVSWDARIRPKEIFAVTAETRAYWFSMSSGKATSSVEVSRPSPRTRKPPETPSRPSCPKGYADDTAKPRTRHRDGRTRPNEDPGRHKNTAPPR